MYHFSNNKIGLMVAKKQKERLKKISDSLQDSLHILNGKHDCFIISILQSIKYCNTLYNELKGDRQTIKSTLLSLKCEESWINGFFNFFFADKWCGVSFTDARYCLFNIYEALNEGGSLQEFDFSPSIDDQPMDDPLYFLRWLLVNVFQRPEMNIQQTLMCSTCTSCKETINKNQEGQIDCIRIDNQEMLDNIANDGKYHSLREDTRVEGSCERCCKKNVTYIDKFELQTSSATVVIDCQRATITPIANAPTAYLEFQALKVPETIKLQSVTYYLTAALIKTGDTDADGHYFLRIKVNDELTAIVDNGSRPKKVLCYRSCNCLQSSDRARRKVSGPCGNLFCR